jgi:hypothetical protein
LISHYAKASKKKKQAASLLDLVQTMQSIKQRKKFFRWTVGIYLRKRQQKEKDWRE